MHANKLIEKKQNIFIYAYQFDTARGGTIRTGTET